MPKKPTSKPRLKIHRGSKKASLPPCPSSFSKAAKVEWKRITKAALEHGTLHELDYADLSKYCEMWARLQVAHAELAKSGMLILNPRTGNMKRSPWLKIVDRDSLRLLTLARKLGLTPLARASRQPPRKPRIAKESRERPTD